MLNLNDFYITQWRSLEIYDIVDKYLIARIKSLEDPSLECTSEADEIVDAQGATIDQIFKAKKATLTGNCSVYNLALLAAQFGTEKEVATDSTKISVPASEVLTANSGTLTLSKTPNAAIKYIYKMENGTNAATLELDSDTGETAPTEGKFKISGTAVTLPTDSTGQYLVLYEYDTDSAVQVRNTSDKFPENAMVKASIYVKDVCTKKEYLAWLVADQAKLNPTQLTLALNSTGKQPVTIDFLKDYCVESADLFRFIVVEK